MLNNMKLTLIPIPSGLFTYHKRDKSFSTEISCVECEGFNIFQKIYDDSCDEGFTMISSKTGNRVLFIYSSDLSHNDEICGWNFVSECETYRLTVFND